jgi:hypothetical protein
MPGRNTGFLQARRIACPASEGTGATPSPEARHGKRQRHQRLAVNFCRGPRHTVRDTDRGCPSARRCHRSPALHRCCPQ